VDLGADAAEPGQTGDLSGVHIFGSRLRHRRIAFGLDGCDLLQHQLQTLELAFDLPAQPDRQFVTITGAQFFQAPPPVLPQGLEVVNSLTGEQAFDAVDVLHTLGNQPLALAVSPPGILPLERGHLNHPAGSLVATPPSHERPQQHCGVEAVGFGAPGTAIDRQAAGVHHLADDALRRKAAV
jgi:hypothetical protein